MADGMSAKEIEAGLKKLLFQGGPAAAESSPQGALLTASSLNTAAAGKPAAPTQATSNTESNGAGRVPCGYHILYGDFHITHFYIYQLGRWESCA